MLWSGGAVSGLVDWASAELGHPHADIGHCRWNLARVHGQAAADRFLELTGAVAYDGYWDVVACLGGFDADEFDAKVAGEEAFLGRRCHIGDLYAGCVPAATHRPGPAGHPATASSTSSSSPNPGRSTAETDSAASSTDATAPGTPRRTDRSGGGRRTRHGYAAPSSSPYTGAPVSASCRTSAEAPDVGGRAGDAARACSGAM